jgi:acyl carrier protein
MRETTINVIMKYTAVEHDKITNDSRLIGDLHISSLDAYILLCDLEEEYEIDIPEREIAHMWTVEDVETVVDKILSQKTK